MSSSRVALPAIAAIVLCVVAVIVVLSRPWSGATLQAAVRFEVWAASRTPSAGMTAVKITGTDAILYVGQEPIVTNDDVEEAHVIPHPDRSGYDIAVTFSQAGAEKMARATSAHMGEPLAIVIDGEVVAAPVIRSTISAQARITGQFTEADATRIARGITVR